MDELCIELSTLKTHINKIYKILEIKSRHQIKKFKTKDFYFLQTNTQQINLFSTLYQPFSTLKTVMNRLILQLTI